MYTNTVRVPSFATRRKASCRPRAPRAPLGRARGYIYIYIYIYICRLRRITPKEMSQAILVRMIVLRRLGVQT